MNEVVTPGLPTGHTKRAARRAEISLAAARRALRQQQTIACGDGEHGRCVAGPARCLCPCHDD